MTKPAFLRLYILIHGDQTKVPHSPSNQINVHPIQFSSFTTTDRQRNSAAGLQAAQDSKQRNTSYFKQILSFSLSLSYFFIQTRKRDETRAKQQQTVSNPEQTERQQRFSLLSLFYTSCLQLQNLGISNLLKRIRSPPLCAAIGFSFFLQGSAMENASNSLGKPVWIYTIEKKITDMEKWEKKRYHR